METFTKNTTIGELLSVYPECAPILMESECTALDARLHRWRHWVRQRWFTESMQISW